MFSLRSWLAGLCHGLATEVGRSIRPKVRRFTPRVEILEGRLLPATFTVETVMDNGNNDTPIAKSLRWAIKQANETQGPDIIDFNIANGVQVIAPPAPFRPIVEQVTITGEPPNKNVQNQLIQIDGVNTGVTPGFLIRASNCIIRELNIIRFDPDGLGAGIRIESGTGNSIVGNIIGIDHNGNKKANGSGIRIASVNKLNETSGNTIGGALRNVISGNTSAGVWISSSFSNIISGNYIGTNKDGKGGGVGNGRWGVTIIFSRGNTIGGSSTGHRNIISDNGWDGVNIELSSKAKHGGDPNTVTSNYIGVDVEGRKLGNGSGGMHGSGVVLSLSDDNQIGSEVSTDKGGVIFEAANVISGNRDYGVLITGSENIVKGNFIGTGVDGISAKDQNKNSLGNGNAGIQLSVDNDNSVQNNEIGGLIPGERNIVSNNGGDGVRMDGAMVTANKVLSNNIGTNKARSNAAADALPNGGDGVRIMNGANNNLVKENQIAFNLNAGVNAAGAGKGNRMMDPNLIFSNGALGITLTGTNTPLPNDAGDADTGPNNLQNYPIITSAYRSGGSTFIYGTLNSTPYSAFDVEIFVNTTGDPSGYGEGEQYLATAIVLTDEFGNGGFVTVTIGEFSGYATATATGVDGTSEFSMWVPIVDMQPQFFDGPETTPETDAGQITDADLQPLIAEAAARWTAAGFDVQRLAGVEFIIADLPGNTLGLTYESTIWIDQNAAGHGWFIDATPGDDAEFVAVGLYASAALPGTAAAEGVDLLSVLMHEAGHALGFAHSDEGVMQETLALGVRHPFGCGCAACADAVNFVEAGSPVLLSESATSAALPAVLVGGFGELFAPDPRYWEVPTSPALSSAVSIYPIYDSAIAGLFPILSDDYLLADNAVADGGDDDVLIGGDGDSLVIGTPGRDMLVGGF